MNLLIWGITISTFGKVLLGIAVILVHGRIYKEHRIDAAVLRELKKERTIGYFGVFFIVVGYVLEMLFYSSFNLVG